MKLSQWRGVIFNWADGVLDPDAWMVDTPIDNVITLGTLPPIRNIGFEFQPPYSIKAHISQEVFYAERVTGELWHNLPIGRFEGIYGQFVYRLLTEAKDIHPDILKLEVAGFNRQEELPITTEQMSEGWLVTLRWMLEAVVKLDPETEVNDTPITRVDIELWTNKLDDTTFTQRVLDTQVSVITTE